MRVVTFVRRLILVGLMSLAAPAPGLAEEAPVCAGRDLSRDPDIKPDLAAHADDLVNGDGLLWKVEKSGLGPSYLFGTIHSTTAGALALAAEAAKYIDGAKSVATELGGPLDADQKIDLSASMLKAALSPETDTLAGAMSPGDLSAVEEFLAGHGYPKELAHHLKIWFLAVAASLPGCEAKGEMLGLKEVDQMIAEAGKTHNLPVIGLETTDEQLQTLSSTPASLAATLLAATAREPRLNDDAYATLLSLYLQKRPSLAIAILDAAPGLTKAERDAEAEFTRLLLVGRNEIMANRAAPLLANGGAFIAVGALHLTGKAGLVERLRASGYLVTKIW